jgi:hypothetical protein
VIPLDEVPLEDLLAAVAAAHAGVEVCADRFPPVFPQDPAAHERHGIHLRDDIGSRETRIQRRRPAVFRVRRRFLYDVLVAGDQVRPGVETVEAVASPG